MPESSLFILFFFYVCFPQRYSRLWRKCAEQILMLYGCLSEGRALVRQYDWFRPHPITPPCHPETMTAAKETCSECDKYDVSYYGICWLRSCDQILIRRCDRWWWIASQPTILHRQRRELPESLLFSDSRRFTFLCSASKLFSKFSIFR